MKKIALLFGGFSGEAEVSKKSAEGIFKALMTKGKNVTMVEVSKEGWFAIEGEEKIAVDKDDFSWSLNGIKQEVDQVFNIIHGAPGENGKMSAYFDLVGIPCNSSDVLQSALTFNKNWCNRFLSTYGVTVPKSVVFFKGEDNSNLYQELTYPCFVKPNNGGSSIGTHKVNDQSALEQALSDAFMHDNEVIVEEFIAGREFSCGIFKSKKGVEVMPLTEIIVGAEFFDYKQKYSEDGAKEVTPAEISDEKSVECQEIVKKVFSLLRLKKVARIDFILKEDSWYLIEVNTIPGMSPRSILPQQALHVGYSFEDLVEILAE